MFDFPQSQDWTTQLDALKKFLSTWYRDAFNAGRIAPVEPSQHLTESLPPPLTAMHEFAGRGLEVICPQNRLLALHEIDLNVPEPVFYVENQGVYLWAFRKGIDNPPVLGKFKQPGQKWQTEAEPLAAFLYQICIFEAIMGAPYGASYSSCTEEELSTILEHWDLIPYRAWRWPDDPTRSYVSGEALMVVSPNNGYFSLFCGARKKEDLQFMESYINRDWEYCNFIDQ